MAKKSESYNKFKKKKSYWHRIYPNEMVKFTVIDITGNTLEWKMTKGNKIIASGKNKIKVFPDGGEYIKPRGRFAIAMPMATVN